MSILSMILQLQLQEKQQWILFYKLIVLFLSGYILFSFMTPIKQSLRRIVLHHSFLEVLVSVF